MLDVTATVRIEDSGNHLGKTDALALLHLFDTGGIPLLGWLLCDGPVIMLGTSYPESGVQHVFLADGEGIHINYFVLQVLEAGFFVRTLGFDGQAEKSGDGATDLKESVGYLLVTNSDDRRHTYLWQRRGRDFGLALVEESGGSVGEVDTKARRDGQTPLVPEAGRYSDVRTLAKICNGITCGHCKSVVSE